MRIVISSQNYKDGNCLELGIAIDGKNMLLFNPGDIDALAEQMEKMISNENLRHSIAADEYHIILTRAYYLQCENDQ